MRKALTQNKTQELVKKTPQEAVASKRSRLSGSASSEFTALLVGQAKMAVPGLLKPGESELDVQKMKAVEGALCGIAPQDEVEGMLAAQMVALHNAAMDSFKVASVADYKDQMKHDFQNQGIKLSRTFAGLSQALGAHRQSKSIVQNLTVGAVNVHQGGQAIVGNNNTPIKRADGTGV